jgi:hypothetical protein
MLCSAFLIPGFSASSAMFPKSLGKSMGIISTSSSAKTRTDGFAQSIARTKQNVRNNATAKLVKRKDEVP